MITRSAPSFVTSGEGSFGLQIGAQAVDAILLIMNKSGVESLLKVKCKLGIDASIAAGPVGRDVDVKVGPDTAFLVYARAKGFYGGLSPEGGIITQDNSANERFYGEEVNLFLTTQIISTPCTCAIKIPITTGRVNIRIHRAITAPPHSPSILLSQESAGARNGGKQDMVWGGVEKKFPISQINNK